MTPAETGHQRSTRCVFSRNGFLYFYACMYFVTKTLPDFGFRQINGSQILRTGSLDAFLQYISEHGRRSIDTTTTTIHVCTCCYDKKMHTSRITQLSQPRVSFLPAPKLRRKGWLRSSFSEKKTTRARTPALIDFSQSKQHS